jgi:hypothetical protein
METALAILGMVLLPAYLVYFTIWLNKFSLPSVAEQIIMTTLAFLAMFTFSLSIFFLTGVIK